ncbi:histidine phosphatase family protein [Streptomyces sp. CSDS2]|uniref:histidine phosphatase family protein n=1 Tax=Streptomyces sp. CSDS2 TaxID=3055051 RepID=UPI0025B16142|nr:histidine phosphatase family protein [Streptomyces sp. CSDS2]MDN3258674.1 histidine phosphatase family protein [Streptomyces sp. CSDS2]
MVTVRLTMLCATATPGGPDRDLANESVAGAMRAALPPYARALRAPSARCARTAGALAVEATPEETLRDLDHGAWDGRPLRDIAAKDPHGLSAWLTDPEAAPHGGESVARLCDRTAAWLTALPDGPGLLAITEAAVIRAALVHALAVPARAFWQLRVPPLSTVTLTMRDGHWTARLTPPTAPRRMPPTAGGSVPGAVLLTLPADRERLCPAGRP